MKTMRVQPVSLEDDAVRLEPLAPGHAGDLLDVLDTETFEYMRSGPASIDRPAVDAYVAALIAKPGNLAFAVIDRASGRAMGSTSYRDISPENFGLEIGSTWIAPYARGTGINTRMKRLLITHAFDDLGAIRVELRTDVLNARSRRAIEKLGALEEGVLRAHIIMPTGRLRDTVVYAITANRWEQVRRANAWA